MAKKPMTAEEEREWNKKYQEAWEATNKKMAEKRAAREAEQKEVEPE